MPLRLIATLALLAICATAGYAADLQVLQQALDKLDAAPADAQAPSKLSTDERRARMQDQAAAIRKAIESAQRVVIVNVPAYTLTAYENGGPVLESKVVVGAVGRKTPLVETEVAAIQLNPAWSAPPKVIKGDLTRNGSIDARAVRRKGLTVLDDKGKPLPEEALSFIGPEQTGRLRFYQPPGERNALGQVKVVLKGLPDIYLHDTPNKSAFRKTKRALSSGCIRVEKARELAAWLTGKSPADIDRLIGTHATRTLAAQPTQVVVGYWLSDTVGDQVVFVDDIYHRGTQHSVPAASTVALDNTHAAPLPAAPSPAAAQKAIAESHATDVPQIALASATAAPAEAKAPAPVEPEPPMRRARITPANAAPWVDSYIRAALVGLDLRALRIAVSSQLPPTSAVPTVSVVIDRNGYVRSANLDGNVALPAVRAIMEQHFDQHRRTVPFPERLAHDLDELVVPVTLRLPRNFV